MADAPTPTNRPKPPPDSPEILARITEGLDLVDILARQLRRQFGPYVQIEDLTSQGREALLAAARSFDPDRGVPFRRWANLRIRGAMIDAVRSHGNLPRRVYRKLRAVQAADRVHENAAEEQASSPVASAADADRKLGDELGTAAMAMAIGFLSMKSGEALERAEDSKDSPEEAVATAELLTRIRAAIAERPEAERRLLERHYFEDVNFEETARELGLSKSWASRLHTRAIEGVAKALKRDGVESRNDGAARPTLGFMRIGGENGVNQVPVAQATGTRQDPSGGGTGSRDTPSGGPSPFARVLHGLGREVDRGEKVVRRAVDGGGQDLGPAELLALQAGVYRYSEAVDLSAKLVDRASSGVKTVLQGQ